MQAVGWRRLQEKKKNQKVEIILFAGKQSRNVNIVEMIPSATNHKVQLFYISSEVVSGMFMT